MSENYYPQLPGLAYGTTKMPRWSTVVQTSVGGYELRYGLWQKPLHQFTLTYEFLNSDAVAREFHTLLGFFLARQGQYDTFRFRDPTVGDGPSPLGFGVSLALGTGDGVSSAFPLVARWGEYLEPLLLYESTMAVQMNGQYIGVSGAANGIIQLDRVPPPGAVLVWQGLPYRRVRFGGDALELSQFAATLWDAKTVTLQEVR